MSEKWHRWTVDWARAAAHDLARLDRQLEARIRATVERFATTGHGDVRRLQGYESEYALRVGEWRVRFVFYSDTHTVVVQRVLPRGRAYRP